MTNMADIAKEWRRRGRPGFEAVRGGWPGFMEKLEPALQSVEVKTAKDADGCWSASVVCNVKVGRKALTKALTAVPDMENEMFKLRARKKPRRFGTTAALFSLVWRIERASSTATVRPVELKLTLPSPTTKSLAVKLTVANTTKTKAAAVSTGRRQQADLLQGSSRRRGDRRSRPRRASSGSCYSSTRRTAARRSSSAAATAPGCCGTQLPAALQMSVPQAGLNHLFRTPRRNASNVSWPDVVSSTEKTTRRNRPAHTPIK